MELFIALQHYNELLDQGAMKFNVVNICPSSSSRDSFRGTYVTTSDCRVFEPDRNRLGELIVCPSLLYYISK